MLIIIMNLKSQSAHWLYNRNMQTCEVYLHDFSQNKWFDSYPLDCCNPGRCLGSSWFCSTHNLSPLEQTGHPPHSFETSGAHEWYPDYADISFPERQWGITDQGQKISVNQEDVFFGFFFLEYCVEQPKRPDVSDRLQLTPNLQRVDSLRIFHIRDIFSVGKLIFDWTALKV